MYWVCGPREATLSQTKPGLPYPWPTHLHFDAGLKDPALGPQLSASSPSCAQQSQGVWASPVL